MTGVKLFDRQRWISGRNVRPCKWCTLDTYLKFQGVGTRIAYIIKLTFQGANKNIIFTEIALVFIVLCGFKNPNKWLRSPCACSSWLMCTLAPCRSTVGRWVDRHAVSRLSTDCRPTVGWLSVSGFRQQSFSTISRMKQVLAFVVELTQTPDSSRDSGQNLFKCLTEKYESD